MDKFLNYFSGIHFYPITLEFVLVMVAVMVLLILSAFTSASEVAFFSLDPSEIDELEEADDDPKNKIILSLKKQSEKLLATILIVNNLINVSIVILISFAFSLVVSFTNAPTLEFIFQTVIITFLLLLFGEIMPKIYSTQHALSWARRAAPVFPFLLKIFSPFSYFLVRSTKIVNKRISKYQKADISVSELSHALELTSKDIEEDKDLLEGIVRFGNISVAQAMTPRINITGINSESPYSEVLATIAKYGYSRMPVYAESYDDVKGILFIKDLLPHLEEKGDFGWQDLIRKPYFVPETKKIDDLLKDFQQNKTHMAIVVDEFGGTSGIISMEDILEEIIGEISDEYDADDSSYKKLDSQTYIFEGTIPLNDFFRITDVNGDDFAEIEGEADSLAGLILELKGEIPHEKERIEYGHYLFEILNADSRKIKKVKFEIRK